MQPELADKMSSREAAAFDGRYGVVALSTASVGDPIVMRVNVASWMRLAGGTISEQFKDQVRPALRIDAVTIHAVCAE